MNIHNFTFLFEKVVTRVMIMQGNYTKLNTYYTKPRKRKEIEWYGTNMRQRGNEEEMEGEVG